MVAAFEAPFGMRLQNGKLLVVEDEVEHVLVPDGGELILLQGDGFGDDLDGFATVGLHPAFGLDGRRQELLRGCGILREPVLHHDNVEGLRVDAFRIDQLCLAAERFQAVRDMRLPGVDGVDAAGRHGRDHALRRQVGERHVAGLEARLLEKRHRIDLAPGPCGIADPLALQIGGAFHVGVGGDQGLQVGVFHAREERDGLLRHGGSRRRRLGRRCDVGTAAEHRVEALLAAREVAHLDIEAVFGEEALLLSDDHRAGNGREVLREPHFFGGLCRRPEG